MKVLRILYLAAALALAGMLYAGAVQAQTVGDVPHGWQDTDGEGVPDGAELAGGTDPALGADDDYSPPIVKAPRVGENGFSVGETKPTFRWETGQGRLFKLQFSRRHDFKDKVMAYPRKGWLEDTGQAEMKFTPNKKIWKKITKKGSKIYWRVVSARKSKGPRLYSMFASIRITNPVAGLSPDMENYGSGEALPGFSWRNNGNTRFALFFTADPGGWRDLIRYPAKGWVTGNPVTLPEKVARKIRAQGNRISWFVLARRPGGYTRSQVAQFTLETYPEVLSPVGMVGDGRPVFTVDTRGYEKIKLEMARNSYFLGKGIIVLDEPLENPGDGTLLFQATGKDWKKVKEWGEYFFVRVTGTAGAGRITGEASKFYFDTGQ